MSLPKVLRLISGICEGLLAIPILGGLFVISSGYAALGFMFVFHLIVLFVSLSHREPVYGSAAGLAASLLGWIPFLGFFLHLISALLLVVSAFQGGPRRPERYGPPPRY
ncbi:hypothetical protein HGI30_17995 [Paenibacillus albicereus]|uniref:Uncharacterized protein n=1 Tax=Paenibacillus albicereus TaxID=2726185 RepID=A0A6H2H0U1_9BACL|nr:hypothetical protein [Paenibacillus albicereus]QJC53280.1 hypothetical protein HGI30_17995 [Paenibacillus albicereus]